MMSSLDILHVKNQAANGIARLLQNKIKTAPYAGKAMVWKPQTFVKRCLFWQVLPQMTIFSYFKKDSNDLHSLDN